MKILFLIKSLIFGFIKNGPKRSVDAKKNIISSFFLKGGSIVVSLILVPLTINYVNPTQYGIWITLSSIIAWFSFFDIGFGNGFRNKFAEAIAKDDYVLARIYLSTTYAMLTIIMGIVLVLFLCINPFLNWAKILNAPKEMSLELSVLALIVFSFFCIQFVLKLINTVFTALQKPAMASFLNLISSLISLMIIFVLTKTTSGNLINLALSISLAPILVLISSNLFFYSTKFKEYSPSLKYIKFKYVNRLLKLGVKFFLIQIAAVILYQTSNIIIAQLFGAEQVTSYNVAFKYFNVITMLFGIIITPFWSAFTEAWVKNDSGWIKRIMNKLMLIVAVLGIISFVMLLISNFVYHIWVGDKIVVPFSVSLVLSLYVILNSWNRVFNNFLNGVGKLKIQLYIAILGGIINIPLSLFFGKKFGLYGVLLSTTFIAMIGAVIYPIQYFKLINNKAKSIWAK